MEDLNSATDVLNKALFRAEAVFRERLPHVRAEHDVDDRRKLVWEVYGKDWRILLYSRREEGEGFTITPIASSSRESRTTAAQHVPSLYTRVLSREQEILASVVRASEDLNRYLDSLERGSKE